MNVTTLSMRTEPEPSYCCRYVNIVVYKEFGGEDYWVAKAIHHTFRHPLLDPLSYLTERWDAYYTVVERDACYDLATTPLVYMVEGEGNSSLVTQEQLEELLTNN